MIWIVGNRGMLGSEVQSIFSELDFDVIATDINVDITDIKTVNSFIKKKDIKWIINCAAYTKVDKAEEDCGTAFLINALGPHNLAVAAKKLDATLIHISTDYVFNGKKRGLYTENNTTSPINVYGSSKLQGDKNIVKELNKFFILRTSWLYGKNGPNFVSTMLNLFKSRDSINVVNDQHGSPTYVGDLASVIDLIVSSNSTNYGIYNYTNDGYTTWYDFSKKIYEMSRQQHLVERDVSINPISSNEYIVKAKRPKNSKLSKQKIVKDFGIELIKWEDSLEKFLWSIEL